MKTKSHLNKPCSHTNIFLEFVLQLIHAQKQCAQPQHIYRCIVDWRMSLQYYKVYTDWGKVCPSAEYEELLDDVWRVKPGLHCDGRNESRSESFMYKYNKIYFSPGTFQQPVK